MPTATLTVPASPEQARTARLVAGAAARRAGVDPDVLDDVRLAVAEAVARAVLRSLAGDAPQTATVTVAMTDDGSRFEIEVGDCAQEPVDPAPDEVLDEELAVSIMQSLAVASRIQQNPGGGRTIVLSWPTQSD